MSSTTVAVISLKYPDVSERNMRRVMKAAVDKGLTKLHKDFLPHHFKRTAVARYGGEYTGISAKLAKNATKLPLVKTGMLRAALLNAEPRFVGAAQRRSMRIGGMPKYLYYNKPGTFHKVQAIKELADDELNEIVRTMQTEIQTQLNKD